MNTNWTEERTVDGLRVEITYHREMQFSVHGAPGDLRSINPGIRVSVTEPEPYRDVPGGIVLYPTLASEQFRAPGHETRREDRRNQMGEMGAYVFEPTEGEALERWLAPRIEKLVQQAHQLLLRRDVAAQLAERIRNEHPRLTVEVHGDTVEVVDRVGPPITVSSPEQWERDRWLVSE